MSERVEVPVEACKDCGAEVIWSAFTKKDGTPSKMPFDKAPDEHGAYYLTRKADGSIVATYVGKGDFPPGASPRQPHYKTCPEKQR